MAKRKKKSSKIWLIVILVALVLGSIASIYAYNIYRHVYARNVNLEQDYIYFYINTGADFEDIKEDLYEQGIIDDLESFIWVAERKNYQKFIKAGRYKIESKWNNNQLVNLLRSGIQEPIRLTINNIQTKKDLAGLAASKLELDSIELYRKLNDAEYLSRFGFSKQKVMALIIPNTYEFYWDTDEDEFLQRMAGEYKLFWNEERMAKAAALKLSQTEVQTLASIVQKETFRADEKKVVAGLYLNRVRKKMKLQADPTVIYSMKKESGDFDQIIKRVLYKDLKLNSPYNTYQFRGLPPGPIWMPTISAIEAVLNAENHSYLYFVASPKKPGYHLFAKDMNQHNRNKKIYTRWLDQQGVYR